MALAVSLLAPAPAPAAQDPCWAAQTDFYVAQIQNPARNFSVLFGPKRFSEVCAAGVVVTNGTFFGPAHPIADVISAGRVLYSPQGAARRFKNGERAIDLGRRWGIGVAKGSGALSVSDGDSALKDMQTFLGGGGLLLQAGQDATGRNLPQPGRYGPAFPEDILARRAARTALGLKDRDGKQVLLVVSVKPDPGATVKQLARIMKALGASDAVFYDGGGAWGFAAGGRCLEKPSNAGEDLNPTHLVMKACR